MNGYLLYQNANLKKLLKNSKDKRNILWLYLMKRECVKVVIWMTDLINMHHKRHYPFFSFYQEGVIHGCIMGGFPTKGRNIAELGYRQTLQNSDVMVIVTPWAILRELVGNVYFSKFVLCNLYNVESEWDNNPLTFLTKDVLAMNNWSTRLQLKFMVHRQLSCSTRWHLQLFKDFICFGS